MAAWLFLVLKKLRLLLIHHHLRLVLFLLSFWANVTLWCGWLIQIEFRISLVELLLYALNWYLAVSLLARMKRLLQPHRASQAADFFCHGSWQKSLLVLRFLLQLHGFVLFGCINSSLIANDKVLISLYMLLPTHLIRRNANRVHVFFDVAVVGSDLLTACFVVVQGVLLTVLVLISLDVDVAIGASILAEELVVVVYLMVSVLRLGLRLLVLPVLLILLLFISKLLIPLLIKILMLMLELLSIHIIILMIKLKIICMLLLNIIRSGSDNLLIIIYNFIFVVDVFIQFFNWKRRESWATTVWIVWSGDLGNVGYLSVCIDGCSWGSVFILLENHLAIA
jgi:hypothetical protein